MQDKIERLASSIVAESKNRPADKDFVARTEDISLEILEAIIGEKSDAMGFLNLRLEKEFRLVEIYNGIVQELNAIFNTAHGLALRKSHSAYVTHESLEDVVREIIEELVDNSEFKDLWVRPEIKKSEFYVEI